MPLIDVCICCCFIFFSFFFFFWQIANISHVGWPGTVYAQFTDDFILLFFILCESGISATELHRFAVRINACENHFFNEKQLYEIHVTREMKRSEAGDRSFGPFVFWVNRVRLSYFATINSNNNNGGCLHRDQSDVALCYKQEVVRTTNCRVRRLLCVPIERVFFIGIYLEHDMFFWGFVCMYLFLVLLCFFFRFWR